MSTMHYIHRIHDGSYEYGVFDQSGFERGTAATAENARERYRDLFHFLTNHPLEKIVPPQIVDKTAWPVVTVDEANRFVIDDDRLRDVVQLAMNRAKTKPGHRYEVRVSLVEIDGLPAFIGGGI